MPTRYSFIEEATENMTIKVLVLGDHLTGKTSFLEQLCQNKENLKPLLGYFDYS